MKIEDYKPCRLINSYRIEAEFVQVLTFKKFIKLEDAGRVIWLSANGKNTISDMVSILKERYTSMDETTLFKGVCKLIGDLQKMGILIANWDPLYKDELPQEIAYE